MKPFGHYTRSVVSSPHVINAPYIGIQVFKGVGAMMLKNNANGNTFVSVAYMDWRPVRITEKKPDVWVRKLQ